LAKTVRINSSLDQETYALWANAVPEGMRSMVVRKLLVNVIKAIQKHGRAEILGLILNSDMLPLEKEKDDINLAKDKT